MRTETSLQVQVQDQVHVYLSVGCNLFHSPLITYEAVDQK